MVPRIGNRQWQLTGAAGNIRSINGFVVLGDASARAAGLPGIGGSLRAPVAAPHA